jgi:hypothetical protein
VNHLSSELARLQISIFNFVYSIQINKTNRTN